MEALQYLVFPNLATAELLHAPQYKRHLEIFPEGQFINTDNDKIIASTSTMHYQRSENNLSPHNAITFLEKYERGAPRS